MRGLAGGAGAKQQDHSQSESRERPQQGQYMVLEKNNRINYILRADHNKVSRWYLGKTTRSLTY